MRPPSVVNQTVPSAGLAGSAIPCSGSVMPAKVNPPAGALVLFSVACCHLAAPEPLPDGSTSMPWSVARITAYALLAVMEVAVPAVGAVHMCCQDWPPLEDA